MFTPLSLVIAYLVAALSVVMLAFALFGLNNPEMFTARRVDTGELVQNPAVLLNNSTYGFLFALVLGLIAEISRTLSKIARSIEKSNTAEYK